MALDNSYPSTTQGFSGGMFTDTNRMNQPKDTYRFLLNGKRETRDGDLDVVSNEIGNSLCCELPIGYVPIGDCVLDDNTVLIIITNDVNTIIGIQNKLCQFESIVISSCFHFNKHVAVDVKFRIRKGCERVIYFTDGINPIYSVNLDSLQDYLSFDVLNDSNYPTSADKIQYSNANDLWDCDKFKMFPNLSIPNVRLLSVNNSGGYMKVGAYQFVIRYLDRDNNPTAWFYVTSVIPIYDENLNIRYRLIDGGFAAASGISSGGDGSLPPTSKSITLEITNIDQSYAYYQLGVIESSDGLKQPSDVYIKEPITITSDTDIYTFTGGNSNIDISATTNEFVIKKESLMTAKHLLQIDNRLLLAKTSGQDIDWAPFQRAASVIGSKYKIENGFKERINSFSPKSAGTYYFRQSYLRDEIYAFGIVWVMTDGSESPVFHIPGRPKNTNPIYCTELPLTGNGQQESNYECIYINFSVGVEQQSPINLTSVTVNYTVNGTSGTQTEVIPVQSSTGDYTIDVICFNPGDVVTLDSFTVTNPNESAIINSVVLAPVVIDDPLETGGDPSIPPAVNGWDSTFIGVTDPNAQHLLETGLTSFERWQVYNTAIKLSHNTGIMAYYDSGEYTYPDIRDCNGLSIWGTDICGNTLAGTPIRHHRFPAVTREPLFDKDDIKKINELGVEFFNIQVPAEYADRVQGYYIVRADRNDIDSTIIDKGFIDHAEYISDDPTDRSSIDVTSPKDANAHITYLGLNPPDSYIDDHLKDDEGLKDHDKAVAMKRIWSFHSPRMYFNRDFFGTSYVKVESRYLRLSPTYYHEYGNLDILDRDTWDLNVWQLHDNGSLPDGLEINRPVIDSIYLDARLGPSKTSGESVFGDLNFQHPILGTTEIATVKNHLISNHIHLLSLANDLNSDYWHYISVKVNRKVYYNLPSIKYVRTHTGVRTEESTGSLFGGDIHISRINPSFQTLDDDRGYASFYTESIINSELRNNGISTCDSYYQGDDIVDTNVQNLLIWMTRYSVDEDFQNHFDDTGDPHEWCCSDYWSYNPDFSKLNIENKYIPLSYNYNYCSPCIERKPYRIYYSEQSFQEENTDNYRAILVNNYTDIMGDQGEITNIFVDRDRLFVQTSKSLWQIQTKPNEIVSSESTIFVGTGSFLSIPPRRLVSTDYGYGGSTEKWATKTTEFGTFIADTNLGKILLLDEGLKEISQNGVRSWFEDNMNIELSQQFYELTGLQYPNTEPVGPYGVGIRGTFDPRYRKYIISKRDVTIIPKSANSKFIGAVTSTGLLSPLYGVNSFAYLTDLNIFALKTTPTNYIAIHFKDSRFFRNRSWTRDYNAAEGKWETFYSFIPSYMFNDEETYYTYNVYHPSNGTWKHGEGEYQTYYGVKHPFIIEYICNGDSIVRKRFNTIEYTHDLYIPNDIHDSGAPITNVTFDKAYFYTETGISASCDVVMKSQPYEGNFTSPDTIYAKWKRNYVRMNDNLRDISLGNDEPLFSSNWTTIQSRFNIDNYGNGYIDRVPNELARDINTNVYKRARMTGKWLGVRLEFNPAENIKMSLHLANTSFIKES